MERLTSSHMVNAYVDPDYPKLGKRLWMGYLYVVFLPTVINKPQKIVLQMTVNQKPNRTPFSS